MKKNILDRLVPNSFVPFEGADAIISKNKRKLVDKVFAAQSKNKVVVSISEAFDKLNISNGATISTHHHLRNGDYVLNMVLQEIKNRNLKDIKLAASSIFPVHAQLCELIKNKNITQIFANYISGSVAKTICDGELQDLLIMNTHGGRARSIESGEMIIDVAFLAAPCADKNGNASGTQGKNACGALGYAVPDAEYAKKVVIVTDNLVKSVDKPEIMDCFVDLVATVECIGDSKGIVSGTTKVTKDPVGLKIARDTAQLLQKIGAIKNGFSMQTGAGGTSLAVAAEVKKLMKANNIRAEFASGGITSYFVDMLDEGLIEKLYDVQCFDLDAVKSYSTNKNHIGMSSSKYGNPYEDGVVVNDLDFVILAATEVDLDFNVNVTTGSDGLIMGGSGGHSDTAYGAKTTVIATQLIKARMPIVVDKVTTITTPGESVDVVVTERGIAINPKRIDLLEKLKDSKLNIMTIKDLYDKAVALTGVPKKKKLSSKVVGVVMYRDGSIIDSLYAAEKEK